MGESNRLTYLDIAKGIAILLIVLGHIITGESSIRIWIYSFHVPIFFIITGCLLNHREKKDYKIKNIGIQRFKNLIVPYFTFSVLFILINFIFNEFNLKMLVWDTIYTLMLISQSPLWFLPALFIGEITFLFFRKINNNYLKFIIVLLSFIVPYLISLTNYHFSLILLLRASIAFGFISVGYYMFKFIESNNLNSIIILGMFLIGAIFSQYTGIFDIYALGINHIVLSTIIAILSSLSLILVFKKMKNLQNFKFIRYCGENSLIILGTHQFMTRIFTINFPEASISLVMLAFVTILMIEYPIIKLINNKLPFMLGKFRPKDKLKLEMI